MRTLLSKEEELKKREKDLAAREKQLSDTLTRSTVAAVEEHDVTLWDEEEVADWVYSLGKGQRTDLAGYAELFAKNHISGKRLFLLTDSDLLQIGVLSVGHQRELMDEIERLRQDNHRLMHFPPLSLTNLKSPSRPKAPEPAKKDLTIIYSNLCRQRSSPEEHLWKYLVDFDGDCSGPSLVKAVHLVFSRSIPTDIVTLTQQPFVVEGWRKGPNPKQLEIIVYFKEKVHRPRETRYTFSPRDTGHTEELCVRIQLRPRSSNKPDNLLFDSVSMTSDAPITTHEVVTPSRSVSSPHLSGVWRARAEVFRPPLEPRTLTSGYQSSITDSVSSHHSLASSESETVKARRRLSNSQNAWSQTGSTGAQAVVRKRESRGPMFQVGSDESGSERETPGLSSRPSSTNLRGGKTGGGGRGGDRRPWSSGPDMMGRREQRYKNFSGSRSQSQPIRQQASSEGKGHQSHNSQNYGRSYRPRRDNYRTDQSPRHHHDNSQSTTRTHYNARATFDKSHDSSYGTVPEDEEVQFQRSVSDVGPLKAQEQSRPFVARETVPQGRGRGRTRGNK